MEMVEENAHNEHIKKTSLFKENVPSMGNHLSKKYSSNYYSMGFEFGIGTLLGYNQKEKKLLEGKNKKACTIQVNSLNL